MKQLAICPLCKQKIEANTSEAVDFCKLCGKPFSTKEALNLYATSVTQDENGRKPSQDVIEKFNTILEQDWHLAHKYLNDIVRKEYPKLHSYLFTDSAALYCYENEYKVLGSQNQYLADLYYKLLCAQVNAKYKEKYQLTLYGNLPFLKWRLSNLKEQLHNIGAWIDRARYLSDTEEFWSKKTNFFQYSEEIRQKKSDATKCWNSIEKSIKDNTHLCGKELDDEFILYEIDAIEHVAFDRGDSIDNFFRFSNGMKSVNGLIMHLEKFLSPNGKKELISQRIKREEEFRIKREAKAYKKELDFWDKYVKLLKAGKTKEAKEYLNKTQSDTEAYKSEIIKFKSSLFGVKYIGDMNWLNSEKLAELALKKNI